jgi:branched-chain amino acid aminotransferase
VDYEPQDGVYTVANTFNTTQTLKLDAHLDRLEDSAKRAEIPLELDRARLRAAMRGMILDSGYGDVRFRVTVPRANPDHFIITLEPFTPLTEDFIRKGVRVITAPHSARHNPAAKTTGWMTARKRLESAMPAGVYDTILLDENGDLLEGLGSNFYAILNDALRTTGEGVLYGIARSIVFEIAPAIIPLRREAVNVTDIPDLSEAFITSSSRGIVPVVEIDGHTLGDGAPGVMTMRLRDAYQSWVAAHLEEL